MKTIKLFMVTALIALCAISCGSDKKDVTSVVEKYHAAMAKGDFKAAVDMMVLPEGVTAENAISMMEASDAQEDAAASTITLGEPKVDGDSATIVMTNTKDGKSKDVTLNLKKVDGDWKMVME